MKKGQTFFWFIRVLVILGIFITIHLATSNVLSGLVQTFGMEYDNLFTNSMKSLAYKDNTGRIHYEIIDIPNFEPETLAKTFGKRPGISAKFTLEGAVLNKSIYFNKEDYELQYPLVGFDIGTVKTFGGTYEFKYYGTHYSFINQNFIVRLRDEDGKIHNQPTKLEANMIFATKEKVYR